MASRSEIIEILMKHFPSVSREDLEKIDNQFTVNFADFDVRRMKVIFSIEDLEALKDPNSYIESIKEEVSKSLLIINSRTRLTPFEFLSDKKEEGK